MDKMVVIVPINNRDVDSLRLIGWVILTEHVHSSAISAWEVLSVSPVIFTGPAAICNCQIFSANRKYHKARSQARGLRLVAGNLSVIQKHCEVR